MILNLGFTLYPYTYERFQGPPASGRFPGSAAIDDDIRTGLPIGSPRMILVNLRNRWTVCKAAGFVRPSLVFLMVHQPTMQFCSI
jgi:hypothetical protein